MKDTFQYGILLWDYTHKAFDMDGRLTYINSGEAISEAHGLFKHEFKNGKWNYEVRQIYKINECTGEMTIFMNRNQLEHAFECIEREEKRGHDFKETTFYARKFYHGSVV